RNPDTPGALSCRSLSRTTPSSLCPATRRRRLSAGSTSQPLRGKRVRHQLSDAILVERNDDQQVKLASQIVNRADGGHDDAHSVAVGYFQHRQPEIQVLVVAPRDNFILAEGEDRPDANLVPNDITVLDLDMKDFGRSRSFQARKGGHLIANDQEQLHP